MTIQELTRETDRLQRAALLKARTSSLHERLDRRIMAHEPFASRDRYGRFVRMQYRFQQVVEALCEADRLRATIPDVEERRRLHLVARDLHDLGLVLPAPAEGAPTRLDGTAEMLGWLYVAEGSTLGAAFLLKEAKKLGLDEGFGARHLAAHPQGRGLHWRNFTQALNAAPLDAAEDERAAEAAAAAFALAYALVEAEFA